MRWEVHVARMGITHVSIVIRLRAGRPELDFWQEQGFLLVNTAASRPALGPTNSPIQ